MVHSRTEFTHVGEANAEFQEFAKFMRLVSARRYADIVQRAPKSIAGMRVVMAQVGGPLARGGADEDQSQLFPKLVRKLFHRVCPFGQSRVRRTGWPTASAEAQRAEAEAKPVVTIATCDRFRKGSTHPG